MTAEQIERRLRRELWLGHGHDALYGDDGEMQCSKCLPVYDYKRAPLEQVIEAAETARITTSGLAEAIRGEPIPQPRVTRFEVIDHRDLQGQIGKTYGRVYTARPCRIALSFQDGGQTLKVFVDNAKEAR